MKSRKGRANQKHKRNATKRKRASKIVKSKKNKSNKRKRGEFNRDDLDSHLNESMV